MSDPELPFADMFPEQAYDTPTAEEIAKAEELASEWALPEAEAATEVAAETAVEVGAEAAIEGGVLAAEEAPISAGPVGMAIAGGIAIGAAAGELLWELDRDYLSHGSHMEDAEDPPTE
jgi:hypothetical protein